MDDMKIPEPWRCGDCVHHRRCTALIGLTGDETHCDFGPSRFRLDTIGTLCRLVKDAGLVMTLYGERVSADELKAFSRGVVEGRIAQAAAASRPLPSSPARPED